MSLPKAFDAETLNFYANSAEEYLGGRPEGASRHLKPFLDLLSPGSRILELGCGGGADAAAMITAGFDIDPTDGVSEIAAIAAQRLEQEVRVLRFDDLDAQEVYDAVWANATLHHVPRAALPGVLGRIYAALKPGGLHFANFKSGKPDGPDDRNRHYSYLSLEDMKSLYEGAAGWDVISAEAYMGGARYQTDDRPWVKIIVRKPG